MKNKDPKKPRPVKIFVPPPPQQESTEYIRGRGAQINPANPFDSHHLSDTGLQWHDEEEIRKLRKTEHIETHPKTILNKVDSPDIGMNYSMNP